MRLKLLFSLLKLYFFGRKRVRELPPGEEVEF